MSAIHQVLLAGSGASYQIQNSLRFRASNSANLRRTFSAASTNFDVQTISFWFKRGRLTLTDSVIANCFMTQYGSGGNYPTFELGFEPSTDQIVFMNRSASTSYNHRLVTNAQFRDPSAWYHLVIAYDSSQSTASDRIKMWINGVQVTSFATATYPSLGLDSQFANNTYSQSADIGSFANSNRYFDGYLANVYFIDGQALTPSSFGQTDATTGVWVPKAYSGTFGTNGFFLQFKDATSTTTIGYDTSGNSNNFTTSGISVTAGTTFDQMLDTPTLNYCVLNPLQKYQVTLSNANLSMSVGNAYPNNVRSTFTLSSGKWYWEATVNSASGVHNRGFSLTKDDFNVAGGAYSSSSNPGAGWTWDSSSDNRILVNGSSVTNTLAAPATNDVLMMAYDADTRKVWFGKNGTWNNSGNPSGGTNESGTISSGSMTPTLDAYGTSNNGFDVNFGQRSFAYTAPTGFKALNTANLATPSIKKGSLYMDATLRTGTGATASVSSLGFQPDLVWIKSRSAATDHGLYDSVRGVQKQLESNTTTAETTETTGLTAFSSNGYTVGALAQLNTNTATYVDWAWKEGATPGFDIVTYVGTGSALNVSHTLGAVPKFIIIKAKDNTVADQWGVYHGSLPNTQNLYLNLTNGAATASMWNSTTPTSSVFTVGANNDVNRSGINYISYLWSEIEGFSKFGSYTGNGSTDGPFVWCGFRPRWLLVKRTSSIGSWYLIDTARNTYNATSVSLLAENAVAESSISNPAIDIVSNGIKIRNTIADFNSSGGSFVFAAFAENPFKYSRAR